MESTWLVEAKALKKRFGHVTALDSLDLNVGRAEVHALLGDNGAGKSTLVKILAGVQRADAGVLKFNGQDASFDDPRHAQQAGIETVFQDLALAPTLTPGENVFLGRELTRRGVLGRLGFIDRASMRRRAAAAMEECGAQVQDTNAEVAGLSGGQRQAVAVARAIVGGGQLLIMDEPTAALGAKQTGAVLELIRRVKARGMTVLVISHSLPDVFAVADRVTVLRRGRRVMARGIDEVTTEDLIAAMTGAISDYEEEK